MLETETDEATFHHDADPTRPKVDPAIVPQPTRSAGPGAAQTEYRPPENAAWWD